ncbi:MAG: hypothetical protein KKD44_14400 [Proteobacteria bacterium]|nr:hypothetical protein [Pseudomonadota bacterium]
MNRRLATLIIFMLGMAFSSSVQALELNETGKVDIHGFITQGYLFSDDNNFMADTEGNGSTQFNEIGINFSSDVSERLRMGVQFIARDLGKMGNQAVTIDWAVADYSFYDWLNLRAGKIKFPHGLYNTARDVDMLRTFIFLPQSVYTEGWRDSLNAGSGAGFYGYVPVGIVGSLTYIAFGGNAGMKDDGGEARLLEDQVPKELQLNVLAMDTKRTWGSQLILDSAFSIDGLKLLGGYWGHEFTADCSVINGTGSPLFDATNTLVGSKMDTETRVFDIKIRSTTAALEYSWGNLIFATEYMQNNYRLKLPLSTRVLPSGMINKDFDALAYYGSLTYRFTDWFELGAYYSEYFANKDDKDGAESVAEGTVKAGQEHVKWLKDSCVALRFDLTPNWILKLETHYVDGAALMYSDDGNIAADGVTTTYERYWMLYGAKLSYSF